MTTYDKLRGILADYVGETFKISINPDASHLVVTHLMNGRRVDAIKELRASSPKEISQKVIHAINNERSNPAISWALKNDLFPVGHIIGFKEARDIVVMLELVSGRL